MFTPWLSRLLRSYPKPRPGRAVYRVLRGPDLPTLENEVEKVRHVIVEFVGGVSACAWTQPGEGAVQFFAQAVLIWEEFDETF